MKQFIMRIISVVLSLLFIFSLCITACAENNSNGFVSSEISQSAEKGSYTGYICKFTAEDYTQNSIRYDLNTRLAEDNSISFTIEAVESGLYGVGMSYKTEDSSISDFAIGVMVDNAYPYTNMQKLEFPKFWMDESDEIQCDDLGNEFAAQQILYDDFRYFEAVDESLECVENFMVYLEKGSHSITLLYVDCEIEIEYFNLSATAEGDVYIAPTDSKKYYTGEDIIIEGESAKVKSGYYLINKSDNSSVLVSPQSYEKNLINYIGGGNWKTIGDTIVWETPELIEGYYQIGFSYRQSSNIGGKSYRSLTIDGEEPFNEAGQVGFGYSTKWKQTFFCDEENNPYLVYLSAGKHEIALSVTAAQVCDIQSLLSQAVSMLGDLYIDITKITGETVDIYRDYELFSQIEDMNSRLEEINSLLSNAGEQLLLITGEKSGSKYSVIMNMAQTVQQMLKYKYDAHRYKDTYYSNYCSLSSTLQELREMPLDIDKISLTAVGAEKPFSDKSGNQALFSAKRFFNSFVRDYDTVSASNSDKEAITIWVNWGRDQAQVLTSLIKRSFEPQNDIVVNLRLVNATVIQAVLSGNGPDCYLHMSRSEPVNLAMRGVLYDLSSFDDCEEVLQRFQDGAQIPYMYNGGLYAIPDQQNFYMMFYRKDILEEYGLSVPTTWDELKLTAKLLMRNNMSVWLPISSVTDPTTAGGVGNTSIFPTMLLQNGVSLYEADGKKTNLLSSDAINVFEEWTNYYTKLKFPKTLDFYNRFRTGTTPIGIASYTVYNTISAAASEIDGKWGVAAVPGTLNEDGTIDHTVSGAGTGCVILQSSKHKDAAWEFLKWWTSEDVQAAYSNDLEAVLGPTGRIPLSNVKALSSLSWDDDSYEQIAYAWENVTEIPEYPGSYYVARSIYQAYWNVVNSNKNAKDMIMKFGKESDSEIQRKWKQYTNR